MNVLVARTPEERELALQQYLDNLRADIERDVRALVERCGSDLGCRAPHYPLVAVDYVVVCRRCHDDDYESEEGDQDFDNDESEEGDQNTDNDQGKAFGDGPSGDGPSGGKPAGSGVQGGGGGGGQAKVPDGQGVKEASGKNRALISPGFPTDLLFLIWLGKHRLYILNM